MNDREIHEFLSKGIHNDTDEDNKVLSDQIGLILTGNGAKCAYQVGVIKALYENNMLKDVMAISGSSIGAINGICYAMNDIEILDKIWNDVDLHTIFDIDTDMLKNKNLHFSRKKFIELLDKYIDYKKIRNSKYIIVNTLCKLNDNKKEVVYMKLNGKKPEIIKQIILAASAIPYLNEPVIIDNEEYIDGSLLDNEPIKPLYEKGIRKFITIGLEYDQKFDNSKWPDAKFINICPSAEIDSLFASSLDYRDKSIEYRKLLGYKDGLRAIKTKFLKDDMYIKLEKTLAQNDLNEIKMQIRTNETKENLESRINLNMNKFNEIADRFKDI